MSGFPKRRVLLLAALMATACGPEAPATPVAPVETPVAPVESPGSASVAEAPAAAPAAEAPAAEVPAAAPEAAPAAPVTDTKPKTDAPKAAPTAMAPAAAKAAPPAAEAKPPDGTAEAKPDPGPVAPAGGTGTEAPAGGTAPATPTHWTLSAAKSHVFVVSRIDTSTMFSSLGHDHAIAATRLSGDVTWGEGVACAIEVVVPVKDLKVDPPGYRKMAGIDLSVDMSADQKAEIESNFKGKKQLEADKYPDIRFKAKSCSGTSGAVDVTGDFTMHGVTKTITVPMKVTVDPSLFKANGRFSIRGSDYNMPPFVAPFGALKNLDKLDFTLDFVGMPG